MTLRYPPAGCRRGRRRRVGRFWRRCWARRCGCASGCRCLHSACCGGLPGSRCCPPSYRWNWCMSTATICRTGAFFWRCSRCCSLGAQAPHNPLPNPPHKWRGGKHPSCTQRGRPGGGARRTPSAAPRCACSPWAVCQP